jgi:hypothetical protein
MERKLLFIFISPRNVATFYESGFSPNNEENKIFSQIRKFVNNVLQIFINLNFRVFVFFVTGFAFFVVPLQILNKFFSCKVRAIFA